MKIIHIILILFTNIPIIFCQNYLEGDTLNVVALNGLNLRGTANVNGTKISMLANGEKVIILKSENCLQVTLDGFLGCWIKVYSLTNNLEGYVFDAYLSHFPVLNTIESIEDFVSGKYAWDNEDHYSYMPHILEEYAVKVFKQNGCKAKYFNGVDGESYHRFEITKFNDDVSLIKHAFWEGTGTELEFTNARISEIYYLVRNLIKNLPSELSKINDEIAKNPGYYSACLGLGDGKCTIRILRKGENTISIFFYDTRRSIIFPIYGLRHPVDSSTTGWYIWTGEYIEADNFFKPVHAYHLLSIKPKIIKYLGLPVGYRFLVDNDGYEDVWYDETLLSVS